MVTRDTILTCDKVTQNQYLKCIHVIEVKVYFQNNQKGNTMVVLPTPRLHSRKAMTFI